MYKNSAKHIAWGGALLVGTLAGACALIRKLWVDPPAPKPTPGKRHLVCVGDSITFGAGVVPNQNQYSYPAFLQRELGDGVQVLNFGLSGRTLLSGGDMPYIREPHYPKTFQMDHASYLVMLGTNDSKPYNWDEAAYRTELKAFLKKYIAAVGADHVTVMQPPKAFVQPGKLIEEYFIKDQNIQKVCEIIQETAEELSIQVIDLYHFTEDHPEWFGDGIHPNRWGNRAIAEYIAQFC